MNPTTGSRGGCRSAFPACQAGGPYLNYDHMYGITADQDSPGAALDQTRIKERASPRLPRLAASSGHRRFIRSVASQRQNCPNGGGAETVDGPWSP